MTRSPQHQQQLQPTVFHLCEYTTISLTSHPMDIYVVSIFEISINVVMSTFDTFKEGRKQEMKESLFVLTKST